MDELRFLIIVLDSRETLPRSTSAGGSPVRTAVLRGESHSLAIPGHQDNSPIRA